MQKVAISVGLVAAMIAPAASAHDGREGCQAMDPLQPKCSYTVTHTSESPITGVGGIGDWVVKIERGRQTITVESPANGQLWMREIAFKIGDKVTAKALSPGSMLTVGHED